MSKPIVKPSVKTNCFGNRLSNQMSQPDWWGHLVCMKTFGLLKTIGNWFCWDNRFDSDNRLDWGVQFDIQLNGWMDVLIKDEFTRMSGLIKKKKIFRYPLRCPPPPPGCACIISNQFYWDWSIECDFNSVCIHIHRVFGVTYQSKPTSTDHGNIYGLHWCYLLPITCISKKNMRLNKKLLLIVLIDFFLVKNDNNKKTD